jgi:glucokinase
MASAGNPSVLVYDVGGSHISASVCCSSVYQLGPVASTHDLEHQTPDAFLDALESLASEATRGTSGIQGASLAMPGPFDYARGLSWMRHKMPYLYGVDLRQAMADRMGWKVGQVHFLNDAAAFLLGEVVSGAARSASRAVGITLGTGVGSAFAVNGRVVTEGPGIPGGGEIWNLPFGEGIVEDLISTRAIQQSYRKCTGLEREVAAIAAGEANDPTAVEVFAGFGRDLGNVLKSLLHGFEPDVVVLGGGISRSAHLFLPAAHCELRGLALQLQVSALGERAPLVGAGVSWFTRMVDSARESAQEIVPTETQ